MCFQLTHFPCDDWESIYTLSYYHHRIRSMNYYPLFRVRSWNNGVRCLSFSILIEKIRCYYRSVSYSIPYLIIVYVFARTPSKTEIHDKMGFKREHSLRTICLSSTASWKSTKPWIDLCFVDFKSTFDYVNRHALPFKLTSRGYNGNFFRILCDLLSKAKSRVKWNTELSEMFHNVYGVLLGACSYKSF